MKWSKLLGNLVGNATAAILDMDVGAIYRHPGLFRLEHAQLDEALSVVRALGLSPVALPGADVRMLLRALRLPDVIRSTPSGTDPGRRARRQGPVVAAPCTVQGTAVRSRLDERRRRSHRRGRGVAAPVNRRLTELVNESPRRPGAQGVVPSSPRATHRGGVQPLVRMSRFRVPARVNVTCVTPLGEEVDSIS